MSFDLDAILDELTDGQHSLQYTNAVPVQISSLMAEAVNDVGDITYADVFKQDDLQPTVPTMQLSDTIAQANIAYIRGNVDEAISILHKIIKAKPDNAQVWSTLGMMHEERGDLKKSLQCLMMAAHLKQKDFEQWSRLGILSKKLDYDDHALYCFSKAVSANPFDTDAIWEQAVIFQEKGMVEAAILQFESILELKPFNMRAVKELAKLYYSQGLVGQAIDLFEKAIEFQGNSVPSESVTNLGNDSDEEIVGQVNPDRTKYEEINMLAELYLEANEFEKAIFCIKNGIFRLLRRSYDMTRDLEDRETHIIQIPLPIRVKLGIARLFNNEMDIAKSHFQYLYQDDPLQFCELFFDVGEAYSKMGYYSVAQDVFNILTNYSETNVPLLWTQIASCCYHQGNLEEAISFYIASNFLLFSTRGGLWRSRDEAKNH
jgi:general transcription factor 3C polypeptide 3 (transcription factor C subunit 4)